MIADYCVPSGTEPSPEPLAAAPRSTWSARALERVARHLGTRGGEALAGLGGDQICDAWSRAMAELMDPDSVTRQRLDPGLASGARLSPPALTAALDAMLGGFTGAPARRLIERGHRTRRGERDEPAGLAVAIVAGNIPGLAVQVVLPALAAGKPLLVKSPSREPLFAAALIRLLAKHEPAMAQSLAAVTWAGGDETLERPVLDLADTLVAFGHVETLADLDRRFAGRLVALGPKLSIAVVSGDADPTIAGRELATDVALFEQRGCLSVQTVFTEADPLELATALGSGLEALAESWPPPPLEPALAAEVQQLRRVTELSGGSCLDLPARTGTVLVAPAAAATERYALEPLPGGRTVRIQPIASLDRLADLLEPWRNVIQGAALAGDGAWRAVDDLAELGVSRMARTGELQRPDALWANGDQHLLDVFSS